MVTKKELENNARLEAENIILKVIPEVAKFITKTLNSENTKLTKKMIEIRLCIMETFIDRYKKLCDIKNYDPLISMIANIIIDVEYEFENVTITEKIENDK